MTVGKYTGAVSFSSYNDARQLDLLCLVLSIDSDPGLCVRSKFV